MRRPSFLEGAAVALAAAFAVAMGHPALAWVLPLGTSARLLTLFVALAYLLYLLRRSPERVGRVATLALWSIATGAVWLAWLPLGLFVLVQIGLLWLVRSLYFHQAPLAALADLGLTGAATVAALGAYLHTGSPFLAVWCLFLVQALFVLIPSRSGPITPAIEEDRFERAHRSAEAAVRKLGALH